MLYLFVFTHYPAQNRFALLLEMPVLVLRIVRFALLLEMLCPYFTHYPTQNRFALLLEML